MPTDPRAVWVASLLAAAFYGAPFFAWLCAPRVPFDFVD